MTALTDIARPVMRQRTEEAAYTRDRLRTVSAAPSAMRQVAATA